MAKATKQTAAHFNWPTDPRELVAMCRRLQWDVKDTPIGWQVDNRGGGTANIPKRLAGRSAENTWAALKRASFVEAWIAHEEKQETEKKDRLAKDRAAADRRATQLAAKSAAVPTFMAPASIEPPTTTTRFLTGANGKVDADGTPVPYVEEVDITPEYAFELLNRPRAITSDGTELVQRTLSMPFVDRLVKIILNGEWRVTHQGLALAPEEPHNTGAVLDGQHRLRAIFESGVTVRARITRNENPDNFVVMDAGHSRTTANVLGILGHKLTTHLASAAKLLFVDEAYRSTDFDGRRTGPHWTSWNRVSTSRQQDVATVQKWNGETRDGVWWPRIDTCMTDVNDIVKHPQSGNRAGFSVFLATQLQAWPEGEDAVRSFLRVAASGFPPEGETIVEGDTRFTLRGWLLTGTYKDRWSGQVRELTLVAARMMFAYYMIGKRVNHVRITEGTAMPLPYRPDAAEPDPDAAT